MHSIRQAVVATALGIISLTASAADSQPLPAQAAAPAATADIVAFLNALSWEFPRQPLPQLPPTPGGTIID